MELVTLPLAVFMVFVLLADTNNTIISGNKGFRGASIGEGSTHVSFHPPNYTVCGDGNCKCTTTLADCSQTNLTYIPTLPPAIRFLNFTYNNLQEIKRGDFFLNVTKLEHMELGGNGLRFINSSAFQPFRKLRILDLGFSKLTYKTLAPVLSVHTLEKLVLIGNGLEAPPSDLFYRYPLPHLEDLQMYNNRIQHVNMSVYVPLRSLRKLYLDSNNFIEIFSDLLPHLILLTLGNSSIVEFLQTCEGSASLFPSLQELYIRSAGIAFIPKQACLPALEFLDLGHNAIRVFASGMFNSKKIPNLRAADLAAMRFRIERIESHAFNNSKLSELNLMYNDIDFSSESVHPNCFAGCTNLRTLQLSHNQFRYVSAGKFRSLLQPLPGIQQLYLGSCSISNVHLDYFKEIRGITKLFLYDNALTSIPDGTFDLLVNITTLQLNINQISLVRESTFSVAIRHRLHHLDLSANPFMCNCDLLWFQRWYKSNTTLFRNMWQNAYKCKNLPNTTLADFILDEQGCLLDHQVYVMITIGSALLLITYNVIILLQRYRWHIRLLLYEAFRGRGDRWRRLQAGHFQYDVFVSYAEEDSYWIQHHLMPELEDTRGLKLCIHQRDFIPGRHIVDNIVECVESSKKILMIFSSNFAHSPWCQFELTLGLSHVMDNDDALVITCLHDIPSRDLTPAMKAVMKTTTYIEWCDEPDAMASFWGRLQIAFRDIWSDDRQ